MISIKAGKHDNHSVEFKFGFSDDGLNHKKSGKYAVNTWIFIPGSLDIDPQTYGKDQFYRDIKSNFRLKTPSFRLDELSEGSAVPLESLKFALNKLLAEPSENNEASFEYHIKMFAAIYKSALRDFSRAIIRTKEEADVERMAIAMVEHSSHILNSYRALMSELKDSNFREYFLLGDEFISRQTDLRCFRLLRNLKFSEDSRAKQMIIELLFSERRYKKSMGFETFSVDEAQKNSRLIFRYGMLKKYVESELYIPLKKKRDGFAIEQVYYSLAAGLAMIFATGVAWIFQVHYGNITMPLFVALVVSYMLKDRIKDLMRYYFAHKSLNRYFDHKAEVRIGKQKVGIIKESVNFVTENQTLQEIVDLRLLDTDVPHENRIFEERILLYRKSLELRHDKLQSGAGYSVDGINEIFRLHIRRFTLKMDDPEVIAEAQAPDSESDIVEAQKYYKLHIIMQLQEDNTISYQKFCLIMTRDGILEINN